MGRRGGGRALMETNFQLLLLSPNLLKSKVPIFGGGGGGARGNQFPTFVAESKFAKIQRGGGDGTNFQLLMLSPNLLKSKVPIFGGGGGGSRGNQFPTFVAESKFAKIQRGGGVEPISNF